jgi:hypothetical protein
MGRRLATTVAALLIAGPARSAPSACYSVRNKDIRQFCLARETGKPAMCDSIRDPHRRTLCRLRAQQQRR